MNFDYIKGGKSIEDEMGPEGVERQALVNQLMKMRYRPKPKTIKYKKFCGDCVHLNNGHCDLAVGKSGQRRASTEFWKHYFACVRYKERDDDNDGKISGDESTTN